MKIVYKVVTFGYIFHYSIFYIIFYFQFHFLKIYHYPFTCHLIYLSLSFRMSSHIIVFSQTNKKIHMIVHPKSTFKMYIIPYIIICFEGIIPYIITTQTIKKSNRTIKKSGLFCLMYRDNRR